MPTEPCGLNSGMNATTLLSLTNYNCTELHLKAATPLHLRLFPFFFLGAEIRQVRRGSVSVAMATSASSCQSFASLQITNSNRSREREPDAGDDACVPAQRLHSRGVSIHAAQWHSCEVPAHELTVTSSSRNTHPQLPVYDATPMRVNPCLY